MNGVHTAMTNTMDTPTEALERAHPVRVLRYRLRHGSGGRGPLARRGRHRAGHPGARAGHPVADHRAAGQRARGVWPAAAPGAVGENWLWPGGDEARRVPLGDKVTVELAAGDAVAVLTPGGGGYGEPQGAAPTSKSS